MADLVVQYGDLPLGTTDASVIALTERLGLVEEPAEVLLGLPDVLADDRRQVELEHVEPEVPGGTGTTPAQDDSDDGSAEGSTGGG